MTQRTRGPSARGSRRGISIVEILVYIVVAGTLAGSIVALLTRQMRGYAQMVGATDVDESARAGAGALSFELRHAAMGLDTITNIGAQSVTLRAVQGVGIICAKHATLAHYGIWKNGGDIEATVDDTAMIFFPVQQRWRKVKISAVGTPGGLGVSACAWPGGRPPDLVVELTVVTKADTLGLTIGAPFRAFRTVQYGELNDLGRWWLARKLGSGAYEKLTGPILAPGSNGLAFTYYDSLGAVTAVSSHVGTVGFTLRTQSFKQYRNVGGTPGYRADSLTTRVSLRR